MNPRPNFFVICVDQMASHFLGANGCHDALTPHLDRLAASGVNARRAYCPATVCMPSRAAFFTGLTPSATGVTRNGQFLDPRIPTFASRLADAGYRTHSVGKLHFEPYGVPDSSESATAWATGQIISLPENYHGFQTANFMGRHGHYAFGDYVRWLHQRLDHPDTWHIEGQLDQWFLPGTMRRLPPELHYNHWVAERSLDFLDSRGADPFLLWCSFPDPHHPFAASASYRAKFDADAVEISPTFSDVTDPLPILKQHRASYPSLTETELREAVAETHAMNHHVDEQVGRILAQLEPSGLADNTVVVFISDHGDYLGSHGLIKKSLWQYEELQRVPFILRVPGAPPATWSTPVSLLDLAPTILELAGISRVGLAGNSLVPAIQTGVEPDTRPVLIENQLSDTLKSRTIIDGNRKLIHYGEHGIQAFDLDLDPNETADSMNKPPWQDDLCNILVSEMLRTSRSDRPCASHD